MALEKQAQDQLVVENLALVGYHVSEIIRRVPTHVQREDLAAAGSLALVQAARAYDAALGVPFARYAATRIRGAIVDELRAMDWATRGTRRRTRRLAELTERLTGQLGRAPESEELAEAMGVGVAEVRKVRDDIKHLVSLDADAARSAATVSDQALTPEDRVIVDERLRYLTAGVAELPDKLRTVVEGLFFQERPVAEIAAELGVTASRISQLRSQALEMLRDAMNSALDPDLAPVPSAAPGVAERRRLAYYAAVATRAGVAAAQAAVEATQASVNEAV